MTVELELMWQRRRGLESTLGLGHSMHRGLEVGGNGIQEPKDGECEGGAEVGRGELLPFIPCGTFTLRVIESWKGLSRSMTWSDCILKRSGCSENGLRGTKVGAGSPREAPRVIGRGVGVVMGVVIEETEVCGCERDLGVKMSQALVMGSVKVEGPPAQGGGSSVSSLLA